MFSFQSTFKLIKDDFGLGINFDDEFLRADFHVVQKSNGPKTGIGTGVLAESKRLYAFPAEDRTAGAEDVSDHDVGRLVHDVAHEHRHWRPGLAFPATIIFVTRLVSRVPHCWR